MRAFEQPPTGGRPFLLQELARLAHRADVERLPGAAEVVERAQDVIAVAWRIGELEEARIHDGSRGKAAEQVAPPQILFAAPACGGELCARTNATLELE